MIGSFRILLCLALVVGACSAHAQMRSCADIFRPEATSPAFANPATLGEPTAESILNLLKGEYVVHLRRMRVAGTLRQIVLVGERHVKTSDDTRRFVELLQHFDVQAVEGLPVQHYWFSEKLREYLNYKKSIVFNRGSSILTVHARDDAFILEEETALKFYRMIQAGELDLATATFAIKSGDYFEHLRLGVLGANEDIKSTNLSLAAIEQLSAEKILSQLHDRLGGNEPKISPPSTRTLKLEENYRPTLREKAGSALFTVSKFIRETRACYTGVCLGSAFAYFISGDHTMLTIGASGLAAMAAVATNRVRDFGFNTLAAVERRDRFMVSALLEKLNDDPSIDTILVVVGKAHVDGMAQALENYVEPQVAPATP